MQVFLVKNDDKFLGGFKKDPKTQKLDFHLVKLADPSIMLIDSFIEAKELCKACSNVKWCIPEGKWSVSIADLSPSDIPYARIEVGTIWSNDD